MDSYDLAVFCYHETRTLSIDSQMPANEINELIASHFNIDSDSFELQVYDDHFQRYIDFDDEYTERIRQMLPRMYRKMLHAEVLFKNASETETVSCFSMF